MTGLVSTSKKSAERRWLSRASTPVSIDAVRMVTEAVEAARSSATVIVPSNSRKVPRTLAIPAWRVMKPISVWVGSRV